MKIRGAEPLFNPISIGELGLQGLGAALQIHKAYEDSKTMDFAKNAILSGKFANELPGSPIRHALSTVTGGLISPNEELTGDAAVAQLGVLNNIQKTKMAEINTLANVRGKTGSAPFQPGTPMGDQAKNLGIDLSGQTPMEGYRQTEANTAQQRLGIDQQRLGIEQDRSKQQLDEFNQSFGLKQQDLGLREKQLGVSEAGLGLRERALQDTETKMTPGYQQAAKANSIAGTANAYMDMSIPAYEATHKTTFVDRDTLGQVKGGQAGDYLTKSDKYEEIPMSKLPDLYKDQAAIKNIDRVTKLITDNPQYFPNTDMANPAARFGLGHIVGASNAYNAPNDPKIKDIQSTITNLNSYLRELNGRSPNATQMAQDSNVLIPNLGSYTSRADAQTVALDKLQRLRANIKGLHGGDDEGGPNADDISAGLAGEIATPDPMASTIVSH